LMDWNGHWVIKANDICDLFPSSHWSIHLPL
jgi:hypothetical protein